MNSPDPTPPTEPMHAPRRWRLFAVMAGVAALIGGCRDGTTPTLRDEGKSVGELRAMLADPDPEVQARGAFGLSRHGPDAREVVPDLIPKLKSPASLVRQNTALALAAIGPDA